jgi:SNF2 family DNA or RNA helicase
VRIEELTKAIRADTRINQIIVDEGDEFRNHDREKFKALQRMIRPDQRVWWMTGTPCPNEPTDAWAQARIVNPNNVTPYFGKFKTATMIGQNCGTFSKWSPRPEGYEIAFKAMQPAIRFKKAECLDLPPVMVEDRQCEMTKEQRKAFDAMRKDMIMEAKTKQITAVNAADKIGKLRQILCGAIKDPITDEYMELPHAPRTNILLEAIKSANAKVYVVVPFKGITHALQREVAKHYSVDVLNGDVPASQRSRIITAFKTQPDPHVVLCHPKVTSHGINFVEADTLVIYAPIYSNSQFQQVIERFNRPGQTRSMRIIRIGAHPLEWSIYKLVDTRREMQDNILKLYKSVMDGTIGREEDE